MDEESPETQSSDAEDESSNRVQRAAELCFGTSTVIVGLALEGFGVMPYQRPLPVQPTQNGGFVLNLAYTELYNGETVPGKFQNSDEFSMGEASMNSNSLLQTFI